MFAPDEWPEDVLPNPDNCLPEFSACNYTAECCRPGGENVVICNDDDRCEVLTNAEVAGGGYSFEPFCLAWSKTAPDAKSIDTFAFAPALPWPPIQPLPLVLNLLPFCPIPLDEFSDLPDGLKVLSCKLCQFTYGFPIADIVLAKVKHKLTVQWCVMKCQKTAIGTGSATLSAGIRRAHVALCLTMYFPYVLQGRCRDELGKRRFREDCVRDKRRYRRS